MRFSMGFTYLSIVWDLFSSAASRILAEVLSALSRGVDVFNFASCEAISAN